MRSIYRQSLKLARKFPTENLREFFKRRVREDFRVSDFTIVKAQANLEQMRRCVVVQTLYFDENKKTCIE